MPPHPKKNRRNRPSERALYPVLFFQQAVSRKPTPAARITTLIPSLHQNYFPELFNFHDMTLSTVVLSF